MNKLSVVLLAALLVANGANAKDGLYVGLDVLRAEAEHNYKIVYNPGGDYIDTGAKTKANSMGFSGDIGYKFSFDKAFIAPEIFYDRLNNTANDYTSGNDPSSYKDNINLNSRYGAKLNLGYNILPKLAVFVNAGFANVRYSVKWPSIDDARYGHKLAMVYGIGASYSLNENWALRTSYDKQEFNIQWVYEGLRSKVDLTVVKAGVVYSF